MNFCNCGIQSKTPIICCVEKLKCVGQRHFKIPEKNIIPHVDEDQVLITNMAGDNTSLWRTPYKVEEVNQVSLFYSHKNNMKQTYI